MMKKIVAAVLTAVAVCATKPVGAQESGTFTVIGTFDHNYARLEFGDVEYVAGQARGTGTIVEATGGLFEPGQHGDMICLVHGTRTAAGFDLKAPCTWAEAQDASLYMLAVRRAGDVEAGGGGEGSFELLGGTGRFDGVGGTCGYETDYLAGERFVTIARCAWEK